MAGKNVSTAARPWRQLNPDLYCIDAGYIQPWLACIYLLCCGDDYVLIETGTANSLENIQRCMADLGVHPEQLRYVIPTHVHLDHAGGAGACLAAFERAQLCIHPRGQRHMVDPQRLVDSARAVYGEQRFRELYGEIQPVDAARVLVADDGEWLAVGERRLQFRYTAGHADHHFCVWDAGSQGWFAGDMFGVSYPFLAFPGGRMLFPSTTPTQFRPEAYRDSLALLDSYAPQWIYLTHSGELGYSRELRAALEQQLLDYCELASAGQPEEAELEQRLLDHAISRARDLGYVGSADKLREALAMDAGLNAQGLLSWRAREQASQAGRPAQ